MANSPSAKKRDRQNARRRARNRWRKDQIKHVVKAFEAAVGGGDRAKAVEQLRLCYKKLDQIASKNTIHKNAAARKKARLAKRLAKMPA